MLQAGAIAVRFTADIKDFVNGFKNAIRETDGLRQAVVNSANTLRQIQQRLTSTTQSTQQLGTELRQTATAANRTGTEMRQTARQVDEVGDSSRSASDGLNTLAEALASVGLTAGTFALFTGEVNEFENALKKLAAQTGKTGKELQIMRDSAMKMYRQGLGEDINDVTNAVSQAERMFDNVYENHEKIAQAGLKFNKIFGEDTAEAFKAASRMSDAFAIKGERALDIISKAMQETGDPARDLLDTFWEYSGYMAQLGYNEELFANRVIYGLKNGAFNSDKIGDAFKEVELRIKGMDKTAQNALIKMGLDVMDVIDNINKGGEAARKQIDDVFLRIGHVRDTAERKNIITALVGAIGEDLGDKFFTNYNEALQMTYDYQNALNQSFEQFAENNMAYSLEQMTRSFKELGYTIWSSIAPAIIWLAKNITFAVNALTDFLKKHPILAGFIGTIIALGIAFGAFVTTVLTVSQVIKIWGAFVAIVKTWTIAARLATAAQWLWNVALTANPVGIIIVAVAGLITLIGVLIHKMGGFGNFFKGIGNLFKTISDGILKGLKAIGDFFTVTLPRAVLKFVDIATKPLRIFLDMLLYIPRMLGKLIGFEIPMFSQMDITKLGGGRSSGSGKTVYQTNNVNINTNSVSAANTPTLAANLSNYMGKEALRY